MTICKAYISTVSVESSVQGIDCIRNVSFLGTNCRITGAYSEMPSKSVRFLQISTLTPAHIDVLIPNWGDVAENLIGRNRLAYVDR